MDINDTISNSSTSNDSSPACSKGEIVIYKDVALYLSIVVTILIVILNSVVIWIIARRRKITRLYFLLLNLAVADLATGLVDVLPRTLERANNFYYLAQPVGLPLCIIQRGLGHVALNTSNFILAAMSIDRAHIVTYPMRSLKWGKLIQCCGVSVCWFIGFLTSIPITVLHRLHSGKCQMRLKPSYWWKVYFTYDLLVFFLLPLTVIIVSYTILIIAIYRHGTVQTGAHDSKTVECQSFNRRLPKSKMKSIKLTFGIVLSFVICWSPYMVVHALQVYAKIDRHCFFVIVTVFRYLNCVANPIMFFVFHYKKQVDAGTRTPSSETLQTFLTSMRHRLKLNSSCSDSISSLESRRRLNHNHQYTPVKDRNDVIETIT